MQNIALPSHTIIVVCVCSVMTGAAKQLYAQEQTARPALAAAEDWNASFTRTSGWTGGDVGGTVDLRDGRTLWLFGDSWIGPIVEGRHAPGSRMVNNTLAVHRNDHLPPRAENIQFQWGPANADQQPTAWITPDEKKFPATRDAQGKPLDHWYWPTGGGIVANDAQGRSRLHLFLFHITRAKGQGDAWNFASRGGAFVSVPNFHEPLEKWQGEQHPLPQAIGAEQARQERKREISWGQAIVPAEQGDILFIYGVRETAPLVKHLLLARVPVAKIEQSEAWEYFAGEQGWSKQLSDAQPVADRGVSEFSVEPMLLQQQRRFVLIQSEPNLGPHVWARTAKQPEGPWSDPVVLHRVSEVDRQRSYFTYAAKGHALLSSPGELLITYLVNANDFAAMFNDATIYRPRFLRLPLEKLAP